VKPSNWFDRILFWTFIPANRLRDCKNDYHAGPRANVNEIILSRDNRSEIDPRELAPLLAPLRKRFAFVAGMFARKQIMNHENANS
jgi:hypothetical protein